MGEKDPPKGRKQDPRVESLRPDPSEPPPRTRTLEGLWGDSDRAGRARLYLTRDLSVYAEFLVEDAVVTTEIPPERAPFLGEQATRIELRHEAEVDITHSRRIGDLDEFDLDVRLGTGARLLSDGFASSGPNECTKAENDTEFPCGNTCDAFLCKTFQPPGGGDCPGGGGGGGTVRPGTDSCDCGTNPGDTNCGNCHTDAGHTNCGTCNTDFGHTNCGTCHTDFGQTRCGGCERMRRR